ncbi:MAG: nitrite reductase large subunit NirB, partial [Nitrospiria bacterium]
MKKRLVVIGNGMAGARAVEEILKRDRSAFEIVMFGAEPYGNYNRILLSNVLNQTRPPEAIFINPLEWYAENRITLHTRVKVTHIDRVQKKVFGLRLSKEAVPYGSEVKDEDGADFIETPYDEVIIATGARPFVPRIAGSDLPGVFLFRTIDDCDHISDYAKQCKKAAVIGGGLLGLEAARGLMTHDLEVSVLEAADQLMPSQLDREAAKILEGAMTSMGLRVLTHTMTTRLLEKKGRVGRLIFNDGRFLDTDLVVISAGIVPVTEVAEKSGIKVNRGILCDDQLRTNDPHIYAVGECIEHRGQTYGLVDPIWQQADVLADVLSGVNPEAAYLGSKTGTKLKVMGVDLTSMGEKESDTADDEVLVYRDPNRGIYKKLIVRDNKVHGAILLGDTELSDTLMQCFQGENDLPENRGEILFGSVDGARLFDAADLPDSAQICNCNGVCKGDILAAIEQDNCTSVAAIGVKTKAGQGCGSCRGSVAQLIESRVGKVSYDKSEHYYVPGVPFEKSQLVREVRSRGLKSVSAVLQTLGEGAEDPVTKTGLASLLKTLWPKDYEDERDARFINDRVHANIQKDGTFSVVPRIMGGVTTPEELLRIAQAAVKYKAKMVKVTGGQRIDLLGIKKEDLPSIWKDIGLPSGHAYTKAFRTVKSCVGTDFCRFGLGDSISLAKRIEARFQGVESPHKVKMAVTGCPRNCAEAYVKDV